MHQAVEKLGTRAGVQNRASGSGWISQVGEVGSAKWVGASQPNESGKWSGKQVMQVGQASESGCVGMCQDVSGCVRMCRDVSGCVGMCQDVSGCVRMLPDRAMALHSGWPRCARWVIAHAAS